MDLKLLISLKFNIQKTKIMAPSPITSWQIDGETVADFNFGGSKTTADGDCSHEIKRWLLLGRKVMTNPDSILKSRHITWSTKVHLVKSIIFLVVWCGCEIWTIKKAEHRRIHAFELWCWSWLIWKDLDAGKDCGQKKKGMTEDEMVGWHHQLNGHEFGWTPGVGDGQGGLACCGSWSCKESDTTERMNWTESHLNMGVLWVWGVN